jgi:hypothetical protein
MMIIEIHNPVVEAKIKAQAEARGVSVEALIASMVEDLNGDYNDVVESADPRIVAMREAMKDDLFLSDLTQTMDDFKNSDAEYTH